MYTVTLVLLGVGAVASIVKVYWLREFVGGHLKKLVEMCMDHLRSGEYDRAIKLCRVVKQTQLGRGIEAMIEGYKNGERDPVEFKKLFCKDIGDLDKYVGKYFWLEPVAISLVLAGIVVVVSQNLYILPAFWALAGASMLAAALSKISERRSRVFLHSARDEIVTALQSMENSV